jgi:DNA-binding response OmpR family regulator
MTVRILILDEDPAVRQLYQSTLRKVGYTCLVPLALPEIATVIDLQPDLILLDYFHGSTPYGWIYLIQLKTYAETEQIPVLLCTANRTTVAAHAHDLATFNVTVVYKPFDLEDFVAAVRYSLPNPPSTTNSRAL